MHMHMLVGIVLHTTLMAIIGYALLFSANKTEGVVALIGRVLGVWVFILAVLSVVAVVAGPKDGGPFGPMGMMHGHGPGEMRPWGPPPGMPPPPGPQQPPPPHP